MAYTVSNAELEMLAGGVIATVTEALDAGAHEIDDAFSLGGYVVPIDTSVLAAVPKAQLDARLAITNRAIAAWHLTQHLSDASDKVKAQADEARAWLVRIASGSLVISGLVRDASALQPAFAVAGDTKNVFTDSVFNALRNLTAGAS